MGKCLVCIVPSSLQNLQFIPALPTAPDEASPTSVQRANQPLPICKRTYQAAPSWAHNGFLHNRRLTNCLECSLSFVCCATCQMALGLETTFTEFGVCKQMHFCTHSTHAFILRFSLWQVLNSITVLEERKLSLQEFEQLLRKMLRKYLVALPSPCSRSYVLR